jgi:predicted  nucleic acid-binding Zn-ribbon protein
VKLLAKFKKLKGEVREISAKFGDLEQIPEDAAQRGLITRMGTLERQTREIAVELEALKKENQQIRFDIARLQDLMARLQPEADVMLSGQTQPSGSSDEDHLAR